MNIQPEQVMKIESVSRSEREKGYGTLEKLTETCDYIEMRVYTSKFFGSKLFMTVILGLQTTTKS